MTQLAWVEQKWISLVKFLVECYMDTIVVRSGEAMSPDKKGLAHFHATNNILQATPRGSNQTC